MVAEHLGILEDTLKETSPICISLFNNLNSSHGSNLSIIIFPLNLSISKYLSIFFSKSLTLLMLIKETEISGVVSKNGNWYYRLSPKYSKSFVTYLYPLPNK